MKDTNTNTINDVEAVAVAENGGQLFEDFKHSLLLVSLLANTFILIAWVTLQVTSMYDYQVSLFLFYR